MTTQNLQKRFLPCALKFNKLKKKSASTIHLKILLALFQEWLASSDRNEPVFLIACCCISTSLLKTLLGNKKAF